MEIVKQVGELLLSSIPTIICLLVVWGAYRLLVHGKLQKILAERHARTEGAVRQARAQVYASQESYRNKIMEKRAAALEQARRQADDMVKNARASVEQEMTVAKAGLQKQAEALADQIIQSILRPAAAAGGQ